ncbi:uncharacterized protein PG986_012673 [Apiospora aurea]|uniref:Uncharacterized protein n=1 Tax=Apiospora aurea TaxID=335848 RepID=A0ABR1Q0P4_9PEZI
MDYTRSLPDLQSFPSSTWVDLHQGLDLDNLPYLGSPFLFFSGQLPGLPSLSDGESMHGFNTLPWEASEPLYTSVAPITTGEGMLLSSRDTILGTTFSSDDGLGTRGAIRSATVSCSSGETHPKMNSRVEKATKSRQHDSTEATVRSISNDILCENYKDILKSELPHWIAHRLWNEPAEALGPPPEGHPKLERAYLAVCTSSQVIDQILKNINGDWSTLDHRRQSDLRAKFHFRKKYGRRWAQLADTLGRGILLLASAKLASAVKSTRVTSKMLDDIALKIKTTGAREMKVLRILDPLAGGLMENEGFRHFKAADILHEL